MCVSDERRPMVMVSVPIVNFRLMIDNVSRAEAKIRAEGHPAKAPNGGGHGLDVKDATKQEAVLDRRQSVWSEKLQPFDFSFRATQVLPRLEAVHGGWQHTFSRRSRCGGISIDPSALYKAIEGLRSEGEANFLTWRSSSVSGLSGVLRLLLRGANLTNGSSHSTWCSGGVRG